MTDKHQIFGQVIDNVVESGKGYRKSHEAGHCHNIALFALEVAAPEIKAELTSLRTQLAEAKAEIERLKS